MTTIDVTVGLPVQRQTLRFRLKGVRVLSLRCQIASWIMQLAGAVAPCRLELIADEPACQHHDVYVDKVGHEMRLVVGDRAVRLSRPDAVHVGELLSCQWVGAVRGARAER